MRPPNQVLLDVIRHQRLALGVMLAIALLAGVNWILTPGQALRWLTDMLTLPLLSLVLALGYLRMRHSRASGLDDELAIQRYFRAVLTLVVFAVGIRQIAFFSLKIWVRFGDHGADVEAERRILGLATSAMFLILGNGVPKILTPLAMLPVRLAERVTSARRFIGTTWVVLGLGMAVAFLSQPLESAKALERGSILGGLVTVLGAIVWMNVRPNEGEQ